MNGLGVRESLQFTVYGLQFTDAKPADGVQIPPGLAHILSRQRKL